VNTSAFRPRLSPELEYNIKAAAALAKLSVPQYFEQVIGPLVLTDKNRRIERQALQRMAGAE
tara:strand:- start:184 stop:369 length:186 start_codon:yes stop_codon:yes gene_type:complete